MRDFFPDLFPVLMQDGTIPIDTVADFHWYNFGAWKARFISHITFYCQSRPSLEEHVRQQVAARSNIRFLDECDVTGLCANQGATHVTGVQVRYREGEQREEKLSADLVVDASGRGSQTPQWLASLGYDRVEETAIKVDVGYATRLYPTGTLSLRAQSTGHLLHPTSRETRWRACSYRGETLDCDIDGLGTRLST
jgi:2-polyprenyl-6-methoxyphenol hydroxylase-like FAD-dependent oxidoreductase